MPDFLRLQERRILAEPRPCAKLLAMLQTPHRPHPPRSEKQPVRRARLVGVGKGLKLARICHARNLWDRYTVGRSPFSSAWHHETGTRFFLASVFRSAKADVYCRGTDRTERKRVLHLIRGSMSQGQKERV